MIDPEWMNEDADSDEEIDLANEEYREEEEL
jgi:hypothetical protein